MPNNPTLDAMRLAVMNKKVQKKAIGGASYNKLSKMGQWAFERLYPNRTYDSLNSAEKSDVTRYTNALSSPAVRRRESFSGPTLREQTTNVGQPRIITPADMYGKPLMPLTGDVSDAGFDLTQIAGIPLSRKVPVQGGAKYTQIHSQRGDPLGWASMKTAAEKKQAQAKKIAEQTGVAPYSVFTAMGPESINFSTPVIEAMIGQLHATKPSKAAIAEFNQAMKSKWGEYKANPEFIGIDSSDVINQFRGTDGFNQEGAGDLRKKAVELMSLAKFRNMGFPRYSDVAEAIIDPRLANAERGESGLAIFRSDPNASLIIDPNAVDHFSYNTGIPMDVSEGSMQLKHSVPAPIFYKDIFETGRREGFPKSAAEIKKGNIQRPMVDTDIQGALMMRNDLYQPTNQEWLDANMDYLRKMYPNEYKEGGVVHMKDGNLVDELINEAKSKQQPPVDPLVSKRSSKPSFSQYLNNQKSIESMRAEVEANRRAADALTGADRIPEATIRSTEPAYKTPRERYITPSIEGSLTAAGMNPDLSRRETEQINSGVDFVPGAMFFEDARNVGDAVREGRYLDAYGNSLIGAANLLGAGAVAKKVLSPIVKPLANEAAFRIHQAMTTGQGPLAGALAGVAPRQLITYHGTPHRMAPTKKNPLGEFDPTKIGTGEGAQVYGYGHYLAEVPDVAKIYQPRDLAHEQELLKLYTAAEKRGDYSAMEILENAMTHKTPEELRGIHGEAGEPVIKQIDKIPRTVGALYKVDLPDEHIAKMLDWDKPLSEQPESVQKALQSSDHPMVKYVLEKSKENPAYGAQDLLMRMAGTKNDSAEVSQHLRELGIPGVKYLDQGSRDAGEGTRNFVVFPGNEHMMNIVGREKDGGPVSLDAMRLALQNKKVQHKAGGGKMEALRAIGRGYKGMREPVKPKSIIKEGGGNWLAGSVEGAMKPLKRGVDDQVTAVRNPATGAFEYLPATPDPMNQFIDKQLTRYVKNQMATKEDPIRALAEKGAIHTNIPIQPGGAWVEGRVPAGESDQAKNWDALVDQIPRQAPYREHIPFVDYAENEADDLRRLGGEFAVNNPEALAYQFNRGKSTRDLGFDHLIDELRNATNPASGLPRELLIKPESLSKLSVPQAVERVAKINEWRAAQKAEADIVRASNAATVMHKDYPDKGYSWKELRMPEAKLEEGHSLGVPSGYPDLHGVMDAKTGQSVSLGATPEEAMRLYKRQEREGQLADALKYEGEQMGHCVGGYCPDVASGSSRIFSLRDAKGQPHVTVETSPRDRGELSGDALNEMEPGLFDKYLSQRHEENGIENMHDWLRNARPELAKSERIVQIKGKGNKKPNEEYLPFVQDFVKSGQWSDVGDFSNTGLMRIAPESNEALYLQKQNKPIPEYVSDQEYEEIRRGMADAMRSPYGAADEMKEGGVAHLDKGGAPETPEQELQRFLRMLRINASGGKDQYGSSVGGRFGLNIPVSENVSIEPYVQGFAFKPDSGKLINGGVGGANLNIRFNNGGKVSQDAMRLAVMNKQLRKHHG